MVFSDPPPSEFDNRCFVVDRLEKVLAFVERFLGQRHRLQFDFWWLVEVKHGAGPF